LTRVDDRMSPLPGWAIVAFIVAIVLCAILAAVMMPAPPR
jgi:hypothetical protein